MAEKVSFYQIYYHESQLKDIYPFAKPYLNENLTVFFENDVIKELVPRENAEKIGVCSHALRYKIRPVTSKFTHAALLSDFDVLGLVRMSNFHQMIKSADIWHPGFSGILSKIMNKIGYKLNYKPRYPIYQNHFIAKTSIYQKYVKDFLIPAMEVMESDEDIKALCYTNSGYEKLRRSPLSQKAKDSMGIDYYPMHPFLCERMFSQWIDSQGIKVEYL